MDAILRIVGGLDWSVGVLAALGAALLIARGARIRSESRTAERARKVRDLQPARRGR